MRLTQKQKELILSQETFDRFGYKPEDLTFGSSKKIIHRCDVCHERKETLFNAFVKEKALSHIGCRSQKQKQNFLKRFGVENPSQLKSIKEKKRQTSLRRFGVDNPRKAEVVKQKIKQTHIERYGVDHPRKVKSIVQEISKKIQLTAWKNQGVSSSVENLNQDIVQHIKVRIEEEGYKLLSTEYENAHTKLDFECSQGHEYSATWGDFGAGYRCPECGRGKMEALLGQILKQIFPGQVEPQDNLGFLGLQQVDYSVCSKRLAFEYDGEQHFKPTRFVGVSEAKAEENFKIQKKRDRRKNRLCKKNGYTLIRIKYDEELTLESVQNAIKKGMRKW